MAYREGASLGGGELTPTERQSGLVNGLPIGGGEISNWRTQVLKKHKHAYVWSTGQGTRGMVIRLPGSAPIAEGDPGAHSDGACYSRWRLQATAYLDDVPPLSGVFTVRNLGATLHCGFLPIDCVDRAHTLGRIGVATIARADLARAVACVSTGAASHHVSRRRRTERAPQTERVVLRGVRLSGDCTDQAGGRALRMLWSSWHSNTLCVC